MGRRVDQAAELRRQLREADIIEEENQDVGSSLRWLWRLRPPLFRVFIFLGDLPFEFLGFLSRGNGKAEQRRHQHQAHECLCSHDSLLAILFNDANHILHLLRRIPDRRGVGPLDRHHRDLLLHLDAEALGLVGGPPRSGDLEHAGVVGRADLGSNSGSVQTVINSGEPIVLVQVALATSTVLPTRGSLPSRPGLRSPDQTASNTFSWRLPAASTQTLTIWMRSRFPDSGSRSAATRKLGALPAGRLAQIAAHRHALGVADGRRQTVLRVLRSVKSQPPKKRTSMREPVVRRSPCSSIASNRASRVFSRAHTAARPEATIPQPVYSASPTLAIGCSTAWGSVPRRSACRRSCPPARWRVRCGCRSSRSCRTCTGSRRASARAACRSPAPSVRTRTGACRPS